MSEGKVKFFDNKKGFGFILRDGKPDLFVHFSAIQEEGFKALYQGDLIEYEVGPSDKGEQAVNVKVVERARRRRNRKQDD